MPRKIDPQQQKRNSTGRAAKKMMRDSDKIFDSADHVLFVREDSGLGIWIGMKPIRRVEVFERLAKDYFRGFETDRYSAGDREWVRFGFDYDGRVPGEITKETEKTTQASP